MSRPPKIFVVDDSLSVCFAIERMLRERGLEVVSERSGRAALAGLEREMPDLVLLDLVLPEIDGFAICAHMRHHPDLSTIPVVAITGVVDDQVRARVRQVGALGVLKKPFATEELLAVVEDVLARTAPSSPTVPASAVSPSEPTPLPDSGSAPAAVELEPEEAEHWDQLLSDLAGQLELGFGCILTVDGRPVRSIGARRREGEAEAPLLARLARESATLGTRLDDGQLRDVIVELDDGLVLVQPLPDGHLLAVSVGDVAHLGKARFVTRRLG